jgi:hypothetical protein
LLQVASRVQIFTSSSNWHLSNHSRSSSSKRWSCLLCCLRFVRRLPWRQAAGAAAEAALWVAPAAPQPIRHVLLRLLLLQQLTHTAHRLTLVMATARLLRGLLLAVLQLPQSMLQHRQLLEVMLDFQRLTQLLMLMQAYRSWVRCLLACGPGPCAYLFPAAQAVLAAAAAAAVLGLPSLATAGVPHLHGFLLRQLQHHLLDLLQLQVELRCLLLWLCTACPVVHAALW